ncbi:MAG: type II secretion system protein [Candidatus Zambryskibacteria bacterium]|nr:type II secretion system protein [Candidatus Zambryskibacteria bacterium]
MKTKFSRGFTLVETLVAISILTMSIAATFTAVQSGIQSSTIAKDQVTAFWLAQEGMEFIRNIRDENALRSVSGTPTNWLASLSASAGDPCFFGKTCTIDSPLKTTAACSGGFGSCPNIRQSPSTGLYGYTSGWTQLNFKREIQFQSISASEVKALINISWLNRGVTKSFQISELLFNHQ